jgi:hypothetical protein
MRGSKNRHNFNKSKMQQRLHILSNSNWNEPCSNLERGGVGQRGCFSLPFGPQCRLEKRDEASSDDLQADYSSFYHAIMMLLCCKIKNTSTSLSRLPVSKSAVLNASSLVLSEYRLFEKRLNHLCKALRLDRPWKL